MKKCLVISSLLCALFMPSAYSQSKDWSGAFYDFGLGQQNVSLNDSGGTSKGYYASNGAAYSASVSDSHFLTAQMGWGYNLAINDHLLVGFGLDIAPFIPKAMTLNVRSSSAKSMPFSVKNAYDSYASLGYAIGSSDLAYTKLGISTTNFNQVLGNDHGLLVGLGYKHLVSKDWFGFGEFNYTKYQNLNDGDAAYVKGYSNNVIVGLGVKF